MIRILHIEDEPIYVRLAREALRGLGGEEFEIHHADTVARGIERLDSEPFDLVLLDLHLPDGEGIELVDRVRSTSPDVAIVGLSGTIDEGEALRVVLRGAQDFVAKQEVPVPGVLIRAIRYAIERQRSRLELEVRAHQLAHELAERDRQLLHAQRMEAIGRLAGGVAHDFNNLLTVILGYCNLLRNRVAREDTGPVDEILRAGKRAAELTHQLLAFSRRQAMKAAPLDLNEILAGMQGFLGRLIGEDVRVETRPAPGLSKILADRGQIEQVVLNLAVNARDAMPRGGTLVLETSSAPDQRVRLAVRDSGTGMDPETRARIFEPFFTTKDQGKGTGLGLSMVYGIVSQSGGAISVESELGSGTTFELTFPAAPAAAAPAPEPPPDAAPRAGTEKILVVEDEDIVRNLTVRLLTGSGYTVLAADGPLEALRLAREHPGPIPLLLTDVMMPDMSARELVEDFRVHHPETRVLHMSGYSGDSMSSEGRLDPDATLLEKPFTRDTLLARVREILDKEPRPPEAG